VCGREHGEEGGAVGVIIGCVKNILWLCALPHLNAHQNSSNEFPKEDDAKKGSGTGPHHFVTLLQKKASARSGAMAAFTCKYVSCSAISALYDALHGSTLRSMYTIHPDAAKYTIFITELYVE
jgi:hypothetical protein